MAGLIVREGLSLVSGSPFEGVSYFSTTRRGGVSSAGYAELNLADYLEDSPANVQANRARLQAVLPGQPLWLRQVHGTTVFEADKACLATAPQADAAITTVPGQVLAILTADCLPVVLAEATGRALGVVHAGWRGLVNGVLENTLAALRRRVPDAKHYRAWVGPGISARHFEVGPEVKQAFLDADGASGRWFIASKRRGHYLADLPALARQRLLQAGVSQVELSGFCTFAQDDLFYSYRRERVCGRMATLAWLSGAD